LNKAWFSAALAALILLNLAAGPGWTALRAEGFADPAFQAAWERTDKPVADGTVKRSFYWGPAPLQQQTELYAEGTGGKRLVQYFDKSRMEINNPAGNRGDPFYVTNGLLTVELMTGRMQVGNSQFTDRYPAGIPLASDTDDKEAPTYATFGKLMSRAENKLGQRVINRIERDGRITSTTDGSRPGPETVAYYEPSTGHNVPAIFQEFLNKSGPVWSGGKLRTERLSDPWYYATGFPVTEAYWAKVRVNGQTDTDVYIQAFQRRVLTYVPSLPAEFQVQMGNIGLHYYDWRYKDAGRPGIQPTPSPHATPASQPAGKLTVSGAVKTNLTLSMADLAAGKQQSQQVTFTEQGGRTETHTYRGPLLLDLLTRAGGEGSAGRDLLVRYIVATGKGNQRAVLSWGEIDPIFAGTKVIVAHERDGARLPAEEGTFRLIIPSDKSGARSLSGLSHLEVRTIPPQQPSGGVLRITGAVSKPLSLTPADLAARNPTTLQVTYMAGGVVDAHTYKGVPLLQLLDEAGVRTGENPQQGMLTRYIVASGNDGRQAIVSWGEIDPTYAGVKVMVAYEENGLPIGNLARLVVPSDVRGGRYTPYLLSLDVRDAGP